MTGRDLAQRIRTFVFWIRVLRDFGFNPFTAMVAFKHERDFFLHWLQKTESALGYSVEPPA